MNYLHDLAHSRNNISGPIELSKFTDHPASPVTSAGLYLFCRYSVPAGIADLVASLAGLGSDEVRA